MPFSAGSPDCRSMMAGVSRVLHTSKKVGPPGPPTSCTRAGGASERMMAFPVSSWPVTIRRKLFGVGFMVSLLLVSWYVLLLRQISAVDYQFGAGDIARFVGREEEAAIRDLGRCACALHRCRSNDEFVEVRRLRLGERRIDKSRMNRVDANPLAD